MSKIKVLHIAEAAGGVEKYIENLYKFSNNEIENYLIYSQNYRSGLLTGDKHSYLVQMKHHFNFKSDFQSIKRIRNYLKEVNPDIIYAHSSKAGALARLSNLSKKYILIYNPHGWAFNEVPKGLKGKIKNLIFKSVERIQAPFTKGIICISDFEKNTALKNRIVREKKLKVIYSGIDLSLAEEKSNLTREKLGIPSDTFLIGMVARITETKAPDIFVKAARLIKQKIPSAYFILVGDGDLKYEIQSLIKKSNLENSFKITGWVDNPTEYIRLLDVGVLLSRWEGFGLVLPEYMNANVPIVATRAGGIPNVVQNDYNGILVNTDDPINTAKAIEKIFFDEKFRTNIIRNGKKIVKEKFDVMKEIEETNSFYKKILKNEE